VNDAAAPSSRTASRVPPWGLAALSLCALGVLLRVLNAGAHLGQVSMDENDVVEQAVAFMGGEWRYYLLEYGALPTYVLAAVYHLLALLQGQTGFEYAQRVFFDADQLYFVARLSCGVYLSLLALLSYRFLAARFGRGAGCVGAGLIALPGVDGLTNGVVRVDVLQGVLQMLALLGLVRALESRALRHWLWAGAAAGLAIACKPLPGLLLIPSFLIASWFLATDDSAAAGTSGLARLRRAGSRLLRTLTRKQLWAAAVATLAAAAAGNPSAIDLPRFVKGQLEATRYYSGSNAPGLHLDAFQAAATLEAPFLLAACASLAIVLYLPDLRARLIASFPLIYVTAFWGRPVRTYYLVAPALALCWIIGIAAGHLLERWRLEPRESGAPMRPPALRWLAFAALLLLVAGASYQNARRLDEVRRTPFSATEARAWIHAHIPSGTALFQYGAYTGSGGPILVADDAKREAELAQFFEYGRERYDFYRRAYREAYARYASQGRPRYAIEIFRASPEPKASNKAPAWLTTNLDRRAQRRGQQYILLSYYRGAEDVLQLGYDWLPRVELVQQFGRIALFRVPDAAP
jgi:hypothetical protein